MYSVHGTLLALNSAKLLVVSHETVLGPDQTEIDIPLPVIDNAYHSSFSQAINLATQVGALAIMLIIVLVIRGTVAMSTQDPTAQSQLRAHITQQNSEAFDLNASNCPPTAVNLAALVFTLARMILVMCYFVSDWQSFYVVFSGDYSSGPVKDYNISIAVP